MTNSKVVSLSLVFLCFIIVVIVPPSCFTVMEDKHVKEDLYDASVHEHLEASVNAYMRELEKSREQSGDPHLAIPILP